MQIKQLKHDKDDKTLQQKNMKDFVEGKLWQTSHTGRVSHVAGQWR